jgi:hypothetical protein
MTQGAKLTANQESVVPEQPLIALIAYLERYHPCKERRRCECRPDPGSQRFKCVI